MGKRIQEKGKRKQEKGRVVGVMIVSSFLFSVSYN